MGGPDDRYEPHVLVTSHTVYDKYEYYLAQFIFTDLSYVNNNNV